MITRSPHSLKKFLMPMGDTCMGLQSKKCRVLSQGAKKATPNPPVVMASSTACEAVAIVKKRTRMIPFLDSTMLL